MDDKVKTWLSDIALWIKQINEFVSEEDDLKDLKTRLAVERNIEIIGEAMDRILKIESNILITDSRKIVDTRNRIIHAYEDVSPEIIWLIIERYLPVLENEVITLLNKWSWTALRGADLWRLYGGADSGEDFGIFIFMDELFCVAATLK